MKPNDKLTKKDIELHELYEDMIDDYIKLNFEGCLFSNKKWFAKTLLKRLNLMEKKINSLRIPKMTY